MKLSGSGYSASGGFNPADEVVGTVLENQGAAFTTNVIGLNLPGKISVKQSHASFRRRLWFVVSCIPRYLISGSVEVP